MHPHRLILLAAIALAAVLLLPWAGSPSVLVAQDDAPGQPQPADPPPADPQPQPADPQPQPQPDPQPEPEDGERPQLKTAKEILDYIDDLHRGDSAHGKMGMEIKKENWERSLEMEYWTKGETKSLFRVLAPARERGMATLRNGDEIWNYLPRTNRTIRLNSAMMGDSWAGSHFTNNDLVKESRMSDDYTFEITFRGKKRDYDVVEITLMPKEDAAVEWGKVKFMVNEGDSFQPMFAVYYDEDLKEARYFTYHEIKELDGRRVPTVMRVVPAANRNEHTIIRVLEADYDVELNDDLFSLRNLKN